MEASSRLKCFVKMAFYMAAILLFDDEEDDLESHDQIIRVSRKTLRDMSDPFSVPEPEFRRLYRLDKAATRALIQELEPFMPELSRESAFPHQLQILASLNFLASGSY